MKQLTDHPEGSTQSSDLTHSRLPRRQAESSWFWLRLIGGSLLLHGVLLAIALPLTARLSAAPQSGSSTPVEFVELSEPSPELAVSQPPTESTASAVPQEPAPTEATPTQPALNETIPPSGISFAPELSPIISPSPIPSPEVSPSPEPLPEPSPEISPSPEVQAEIPLETAAIPPQPDSLPLPVIPSASPAQISPELPQPEQRIPASTPEASIPEVPPPEPIASAPLSPEAPTNRDSDRPQSESFPTDTTATAPPPALQPEPPSSAPGLQTTRIDIPVPDVSEAIAAAPSTVDSDNLNSANSEAAPVGVTLSLSSSSRVDPDGDRPVETLELARPVNNSTPFLPDPSASACQVTPGVLNQVGTPIALQIATDDQGEVKNVEIYQSSGSPDYDQLATCLVKEQWQFEPATALNAEGTQRQAIFSDELLITVVIDRS